MKAVGWLWSVLRRRLKWYQAIMAAVLITILLVAFAMIGAGLMQTSRPGLSEISSLTGLVFPAQTRIVASRLYSWQGQVLWVKLELPRAESARFLEQPLLLSGHRSYTDRLGITDMKGMQPSAPSWWRPSAARQFVAVSSESKSARDGRLHVVKVLVDLGGEANLTAYVYAR